MARPLKGAARWLRQSGTGRLLAAHIGAFYIRLATWTNRWDVVGDEHREELLARGCGFIASSWHGRLFMTPAFLPKGRAIFAMISNNRDGDLISAIVARFGVRAVRGSTYDHAKGRDKGGREAFKGGFDALTGLNAVLAITPDGPRGPAMQAQIGIAALSAVTRCPVLPVSFSVRRGKAMRSWDRFLVPWLFGRGVVIYGPVLDPPESEDEAALEAYRARIEAETTAITHQADRLCGRA